MLCIATDLKSNLHAFSGLTFKVLHKSTQSYSFHPMSLMIRHLFTDKSYIKAGLRENTFQSILGKQTHTSHHELVSIQYTFFFHSFLKGRSPLISADIYISSHCTAIYIIHNTCPLDKYQKVRKGRRKTEAAKEELIEGCS